MIRRTIGMLVGVAVLAAGYAAARAEEAPAIEPKAKEALVKCGQYIHGLKSFRVQIATAMKMEAEGMKQEFTMNTDLAVLRPNKLAMLLKGGMLGGSIVCDGTTVYTYVPSMGKYTAKPAPGKLEDLGADVVVGGGGSFPVAPALIAEKPDEAFLDGVTSGRYVGTEDVNGQSCHHVSFEQEQFTWDAWIQTGDKPLLLKIIPDLGKAFRMAMDTARDETPGLKDMKAEMVITFADWKTDVDLPAELFAFTPPADAKKVDTFFGGEGMEEVEEVHPLQGQPAPAFKVPLLGEGELAVADLKDKSVVILDFWATWCGPCRRAMPVLAEVAQAFKDRGVVLYAVNQREDEKTIREYLEKSKLAVTVALDADGKVGRLYQVEGIPQSVIIGKDGLVKKVHVGFLPDLKATLTQELEELLGAAAPEAKPAPAVEPAKP